MSDTGRIVEVSIEPLGSSLALDAAAGDTLLYLANTIDFDDTGAIEVLLNDDGDPNITPIVLVATYSARDEDADTLTLDEPLTTALPAETFIGVSPTDSEKVAIVLLDDEGEAIPCRVPVTIYDRLAPGIRDEDEMESCAVEEVDGEWTVTDLLGVIPDVDGSLIDPSTVPPAPTRTDGEPPAVAPVITVDGSINLAGITWDAVPNADRVTYEVHGGTEPGVAIDGSQLLGTTDATVFVATGLTPGPFYAVVVPTDADGNGPASNEATATVLAPVEPVDLGPLNAELADLRTDLTTAQGDIDTLNATTIPNLRADLTTAQGDIAANASAIATAQGDIDTLNATTIPNLRTDLTTAQSDIDTLNATTIPNLRADLTTAQGDITTARGNISSLQGLFPIASTSISDGAITTPKMTANSINGDRITANTLNASKIVAGSITTDRFTANTIDGSIVTANTLNASKIVAGSITTDRMTAGSINADRLVAGSITTALLTANSINGDRITANTLNASKIVAGSITTDRFTANTIDGSIVTANTLNASKIVAGSITTDRMTAGSINADRLVAGSITTALLTANSISGDRIAANTLDAAKIVAGSITTDRMTANSISGDRIAANTLDAAKIVAGSITTDRMTANSISGDRIVANTLDAAKIVAGSITADRIGVGQITADRLSADAIDGKTITGVTITGGTINGGTINGGAFSTDQSSGNDFLQIARYPSVSGSTQYVAIQFNSSRVGGGSGAIPGQVTSQVVSGGRGMMSFTGFSYDGYNTLQPRLDLYWSGSASVAQMSSAAFSTYSQQINATTFSVGGGGFVSMPYGASIGGTGLSVAGGLTISGGGASITGTTSVSGSFTATTLAGNSLAMSGGATSTFSGSVVSSSSIHGLDIYADSQGTNTTTGASLGNGGRLVRTSSSRRLKKSIRPLTDAERAGILALEPVSFEWRDQETYGPGRRPGLIAEQVDEVAPLWAWRDDEGNPAGVHYAEVVAGLVAVVRDQERRLKALEAAA